MSIVMREKNIHYFYEIKNNVNGKIYRGIHSTSNLEDGYMGSGPGIRNAIRKYGKEAFTKTILKFFDSREELARYEQDQINLEFIQREDTYNQITGGEKHQILGSKLSDEAKRKISESNTGKKRSSEDRQKNSEARQNERWVHNSNGDLLKINVSELEMYLAQGWERGMGHIRSDEFKEKARLAHAGKALSEEHKKAISEGNRGKFFSDDHKAKIGAARVGKKFIHRGTERLFVHTSEIPSYLEQGWIVGM